MLPKKNRADKKTVDKIFKEGRFINSPNLSFKFFLSGNSKTKNISFIVSKNVAKSAVKRNGLRRRGYAALQKIFTGFPAGIAGVFILKNSAVSAEEMEKEIRSISNRL